MVYFNFLNAPVDSQAVVLVYHVIPHGELRKILNLLAGILGLFPRLFPFFSENVRLCDQNKFLHRVFKSPADISMNQHDLAGSQDPVRIFAVKCRQFFVLQILGHPLCPGPGRTYKDHLIPCMLPGFQILDQNRKLIVVRIYGFYCDRIFPCNLPVVFPQIHQAHPHTVSAVQSRAQRAGIVDPVRLSGQQIALLQPMGHTFPELCGQQIGTLQNPVRLIEKDPGIPRKIVEKRHGIRVKVGQILLRACKIQPAVQKRTDILCVLRYSGPLLGEHLLPEILLLALGLFPDCLLSPFHRLFGEKHLRRRINRHFFQILYGPLALHIETADGIDFIPPQFDTPRILLCQRKDVEDTAADGKLAAAFHLRFSLIAQAYQLPFHFFQIQFAVISQMNTVIQKCLQRKKLIHTAADAGYYGKTLSLQDGLNHADSLSGQKISADIRLIENQIFGRIIQNLRIIQAKILVQFSCLPFILRNQQTKRHILGKSRRKMCFLRIQGSGHRHDSPIGFQLTDQVIKAADPLQRFQQRLHQNYLSTFRLYSFIAASVSSLSISSSAFAAWEMASSTFARSSLENGLST